MEDRSFNRWFNTFILVGMTVAVILTTIFKLDAGAGGETLLLVSAFGSLMGVSAAVFSANGKIVTFLFGLLDVTIYGAVCLYNWSEGNPGLGNALLHFVYFIPMQFVGYAQWKRRGRGVSGSVKARRLKGSQRIAYFALFVAGSIVAYFVLLHFDRSAAQGFLRLAVVLDVLPLMCNILGQLLMSTAYMEQWVFWTGVNIFSIAMWTVSFKNSPDSSYALIYVIKYCFYLLNSLNGLRIWIKISR